MQNNEIKTSSSLYKIVKAFLKDFYSESKRGTVKHWRGVVIFFSFVFLCFFGVFVAAYKISEMPFFCGLCHNMKVYVDSWKESTHKNVACIECHYKPGFKNHLLGKWKDGQISLVYFITGKKITKPHAEIDDASCLNKGCHKKEDLQKNIVYKNVIFNHLRHLEKMKREKQLRCTTCHSQIVQGTHITVTEVNCFICHFYKTKDQKEYITGCTSCHFEAKGDIKKGSSTFNHKKYIKRGIQCETCHASVVSGDGHIAENVCLQCHNKREIFEVKYTPERLHKNHVTDHKVECFLCHSPIKHKIERLHASRTEPKECSQCHEKETHNEKLSMYIGKGAKLVKDLPDKMADLDMDCSICHTYRGSNPQSTCKNCHGNLTDGMVDGWKKLIKSKEDLLSKEIAEAKVILQRKDIKEVDRKKINDAIYNQYFLHTGNAAHNILYGVMIADETIRVLNDLKAKTGLATKKTPDFKITCSYICHSNINERKIPFGGVTFLHEIHAEGEESCQKCHSPYSEHGNTRYKGCSECHHGKGSGKVACVDCHKAQAKLSKSKDSMHNKVQCIDCHSNTKEGKQEVLSSMKDNCLKCHKKGYQTKADEWLERGRAITAQSSEIKASLERQIGAIERKEDKHIVPLRKVYDEIGEDMDAIMTGKYAHNPRHSEAVMEKTKKNIEILQTMMKQKMEGKIIIVK